MWIHAFTARYLGMRFSETLTVFFHSTFLRVPGLEITVTAFYTDNLDLQQYRRLGQTLCALKLYKF